MKRYFNQTSQNLTKKDIENFSCFFYDERNGLPATVFALFPLALKRHCVQVGTVAGLIALQVPDNYIPEDMSCNEYANAVRYGSLYHDIGAFLVYNQKSMYPSAGARFLREQISERKIPAVSRRIILETVRHCGEKYNGQGYPDRFSGEDIPLHAGICSIANIIDETISAHHSFFTDPFEKAKKIILKDKKGEFSPQVLNCFLSSYSNIVYLYQCWQKVPPFWTNRNIRPLERNIEQEIG